MARHVSSSAARTAPKRGEGLRRNLTDRARRYRAVKSIPAGRKICNLCGSRRNVGVDHIDGFEEHGEPRNLLYACKSCNTRKGFAFRNAGLGRRTIQFNPAERGARDFGRWVLATLAVRGESDAMGVSDAAGVLYATPPARRAGFAEELERLSQNPAAVGVPSFAQYAWAVSQGGPGGRNHSGEFDEAGAIIHATPKAKRREYAQRLAEGKRARRGEVPF